MAENKNKNTQQTWNRMEHFQSDKPRPLKKIEQQIGRKPQGFPPTPGIKTRTAALAMSIELESEVLVTALGHKKKEKVLKSGSAKSDHLCLQVTSP